MTRILVTDNGPHPPEKWAMSTAEMIVDIDPTHMDGPRLMQAQKLQLAVAEVLVSHHAMVQSDEKSNIAANVEHIAGPHDVEQYLDKAVDDIARTARGTPWEAHYAEPEVQSAVKQTLRSHFGTAQHIERLWHADRNPSCDVAQQYKASFHR